jgi:hypothetical protein
MVNANKTTDKKSNAGTKARNKNAIEDVANTKSLAFNANNSLFPDGTDPVKTLRSYGGTSWSNKKFGTFGQMAGKISSPNGSKFAARGMIVSANAAKVRLVKPVEQKPYDPRGLGQYACTVIDSAGAYANIHANEATSKKLFKTLRFGDCFVAAKTARMFYNDADGRHNIVVSEQSNETFATTCAPWFDDPKIPYGRFNPMNVTHFPHFIANTKKAGRRVDAIGLVTNFKYTEGKGDDEQTQRNKTRCTFILTGKYCNTYYLRVTIWGEQAIDLGNKYEDPEDETLTAFIKNAGVVEREVGEETTIELTQEYNTLTVFVDTNDSRLQESKVNVVADEDAELTPLTNDVEKVGPRFTEEVFLYGDCIETHPIVANKNRTGTNVGAASAQASPARPKFQPKVPFSTSDDDDDDDFAPPEPKPAKENASLDNALGESESERTNVETHRRSPKKHAPKENLIVDDDDESDALPTEVAKLTEQTQSKATKTFKFPQKAKPAARTTPKTKLAKDAVTVGNDDDEKDEDEDEDLSRIQRRSKRTKAN